MGTRFIIQNKYLASVKKVEFINERLSAVKRKTVNVSDPTEGKDEDIKNKF